MANVNTNIRSFGRGDTSRPAVDSYAHNGPRYASQVDSYTPRPTLAAGGPHNRPASGHESET